MANHLKKIRMAYVLLDEGGGNSPEVVDATDERLILPNTLKKYREGEKEHSLDLAILSFYAHGFPEVFNRTGEIMIKMTLNSRIDKDSEKKAILSQVLNLKVDKKTYAAGVYSRVIFKNMLFRNDVELGIQLKEMDEGIVELYPKVKQVFDEINDHQSFDMISNIPYCKMITKFSDAVFKQVKTLDLYQEMWDTLPTMSLRPFKGGVVLREGIYVIYETVTQKDNNITHENFSYEEGNVVLKDRKNDDKPNYMVFSVRFNEHSK